MKDISPILKSLGLQESEVHTYLGALESGPSTVVELAKSTEYSRQATYTAIEALTKRGLMSSVMRGKKRLYVAEPPDKLLAYAKKRDQEMHDKVKDLERLVPELELQTGGERPVVRMFEGREGIRAIIAELRGAFAKRTIEIADLEALYTVLSQDDLEVIRKEVKKSRTKVKGLYAGATEGGVAQADRVFLPKKYSGFKSNIGIYGENKIALITFEGKMQSIIIESRQLARTLEILFDLAFKCTKK